MTKRKRALIFVDTEDANPEPDGWTLREFGAVDFDTRETFHGQDCTRETFEAFKQWLESLNAERVIFVSDNPAYDWPPIHFYFHRYFGRNPFGHSARRISDFYAGLTGDFRNSQRWKRLRITKHDHHPVNDAMGNVEAFERILKGER